MKKKLQKRDNKYKNLQGKPQKHINGVINSKLYYRYLYLLDMNFNIKLISNNEIKELTHGDLFKKSYSKLKDKTYESMFVVKTKKVTMTHTVPVSQEYKQGDTFEELSLKTYREHEESPYLLIQFINRYKVKKHDIQVII